MNKTTFEAEAQDSFVPYKEPVELIEKRSIKKTANILGIALLFVLAISFIWGLLYSFIGLKMGFSIKEIYDFIAKPEIMQLTQIILSSFMFTVPFILVLKISGMRVDSFVKIKKVSPSNFFYFFLIGVGFCNFANIAVSFAGSIFQSFGVNYDVDFGDTPTGLGGFILSMIASAIIPALVEEFAFRGVILGMLRRFGEGFAIVVSSILFAFVHGNFEQIPFAFLVGLVLAYIFIKTESLIIPMAIHFFNNAVSVIFDYWNVAQMLKNIVYVLFLMASMLLAIISIGIYSARGKEFKIDDKKSTVLIGKKYKWFLLSPAIIIFLAISIIQSLRFLS